tara:strand:+ start:8778 stop:10052 length:1275 start_codon:yes stop_codon:yes gene_type:complete
MAQWKKIIISGSVAELASLTLDTSLPVASGGTGAGTLTDGGILLGSGTGAITATAVLADGEMIVGDGTTDPSIESGTTLRTSIGVGTGDSPTFTNLTLTGTFTNDSEVNASHFTGSFTGSYAGDGSALTGLPSAAITTYTNAANNRLVTSVDATSVNSEANLTFDGSTLGVTGAVTVSTTLAVNGAAITSDDATFGLLDVTPTTINFGGAATTVNIGAATGTTSILNASIDVPNIAAGTDNSVVVYNGSSLVIDEIDPRVWGSSLIDGAGASTRIAYFSDTDTLTSNAKLTTDGTTLTVSGSSFGNDVLIAGDLTILGDTFNQQVTNLLVEDRFILLNSGSATGDGGFIVQTEAGFTGAAFGWDDSATRWSIQKNTKLGQAATAIAPEAYVSAVIDVDGGLTDIAAFQQNGNIRVDGGEIFIYA